MPTLDETKSIPVGLIGFGLAGQTFHAPMIAAVPGLDLACIVERSGDLARQKYPLARVVRSVDELLADGRIRLCVVATPNETHFELARRCLNAGRNVLVDKPFTVTSEQSALLIRLAEKRKLLLTVYQSRRFDGDFKTVRKILAAGTVGRLVMFESHFDRFRPTLKNAWREKPGPGAGMLYDLGPHLIDQALQLFGKPEAVTADIRTEREGGTVDDAFDLRFDYPGMRAILRSTMIARAHRTRFVIHGTAGSFTKTALDPQEEPLRRGIAPGGPGWGEDPEAHWGMLYLASDSEPGGTKVKTETGDYREFYANLRDAMLGMAELVVKPQQALDVIRAIEIAIESNQERRTIAWTR
ncbi:MAG TPA: oxidoreductase [Candidatus Acidoferrum sp.]|nr:oxidoreductase [Candidatus Acidoferrum sp.]